MFGDRRIGRRRIKGAFKGAAHHGRNYSALAVRFEPGGQLARLRPLKRLAVKRPAFLGGGNDRYGPFLVENFQCARLGKEHLIQVRRNGIGVCQAFLPDAQPKGITQPPLLIVDNK